MIAIPLICTSAPTVNPKLDILVDQNNSWLVGLTLREPSDL
jgi:hypothetical protein